MKFFLYSGAGNTFLIGDNRQGQCSTVSVANACVQAGVDGLIFLENSVVSDGRMRIFNRDGSEAEMCGNGLRSLIHFMNEIGVQRSIYQIETLAGVHRGWFVEDQVCIALPKPSAIQHFNDLRCTPSLSGNTGLSAQGDSKRVHFINTGVPHAILFVEDLESIDVNSLGSTIRYSAMFSPHGTNVNFASLSSEGLLSVRTYERGVEAETLACGTGATATALAAHQLFSLPSPVKVKVRSGDTLTIYFNSDLSDVTLQGPVAKLREEYI